MKTRYEIRAGVVYVIVESPDGFQLARMTPHQARALAASLIHVTFEGERKLADVPVVYQRRSTDG
jgi:hypothetical protein